MAQVAGRQTQPLRRRPPDHRHAAADAPPRSPLEPPPPPGRPGLPPLHPPGTGHWHLAGPPHRHAPHRDPHTGSDPPHALRHPVRETRR